MYNVRVLMEYTDEIKGCMKGVLLMFGPALRGYEVHDCLLDCSQQTIERQSSCKSAARQSRAHVQHYVITHKTLEATPFMQPINQVSLTASFIPTLRMARASSQNV